MSPFQPTVVLGFSKYTRIMICKSSLNFSARTARRSAYSRPALGSCIEQGPTTARTLLSEPWRMSLICLRLSKISCDASSDNGSSSIKLSGGITSSIPVIRTSSVKYFMVLIAIY